MGKTAFLAMAVMALLADTAIAQTPAAPAPARRQPIQVLAPKPAGLAPYTGPNRPVWRLNEILAAHRGSADWAQTIVTTRDFIGQWISMGAGQKTKTVMYADDRVFWVIQSGQIRFTIAGQEPFVATKGFVVQVPYRTFYSLERWARSHPFARKCGRRLTHRPPEPA